MSSSRPSLVLSTAPFVKDPVSTPRIMLEVVAAAGLVLAAAVLHFGVSALLVVAAAVAGSVGTEWLASRRADPSPLRDNTALLTGLLLGLTLPPGLPLWMAFCGGVAGIGLGKLVWGGLGQNIFNPALVGRAFLQAAFPTAITTWAAPAGTGGLLDVNPSLLAAPLMRPAVDAVSTATPLGLSKFEGVATGWGDLLLGNTAGSIGETNAVLLLAVGLWLGARRLFDWRLPVATMLSVAACGGVLHLISPERWPDPMFLLLSGGLLFAAVFMVTDPATTPTTPKGAWIFGIGVGFLVVLIRLFGGLPEGVMYAILLMNAVTPHIERRTQPRVFGS